MAELPPKLPDYDIQNILIPSHKVEQRVDLPFEVCHDVLNVIIEIKDGVAKITKKAEISGETQSGISQLSEELKKELIEKFKKLPDYEGSKVQEAIENGKLEIIKTKPVFFKKQKLEIEVKDNKYALYEKGGNLLYFVELNGEKYFNVDRVRNGLTGGGLESGIEIFFGGKQVLENGIYNIYIGDRKLELNSKEYIDIMLISCQDELNFAKALKEDYERRFNKKID